MLLYQPLAFITHERIQKSHIKIIKLKYQLRHGMKNLIKWSNLLMIYWLIKVYDIKNNALYSST